MNEAMSVYRLHSSSTHSSLTSSLTGQIKAIQMHCHFWLIIHESKLINEDKITYPLSRAIDILVDQTNRAISYVEASNSWNLETKVKKLKTLLFRKLKNLVFQK